MRKDRRGAKDYVFIPADVAAEEPAEFAAAFLDVQNDLGGAEDVAGVAVGDVDAVNGRESFFVRMADELCDGFFGIDTGLSKSWTLRESLALKFAWEVFNVTNSVRFDDNPNTSLGTLSSSQNLGVYSKLLTTPRVQQFSLRLSF